MAEPLRHPKMADRIADELRALIVNGQVAPEQNLPRESELAAHFGVSVATIRQAIRMLESESLVGVRAGGREGAVVREVGSAAVARQAGLLLQRRGALISDVLAARLILEPAAVRMYAERGPTEAEVAALEAAVEPVPRLPASESDVVHRGATFHRLLLEFSGNETLRMIGEILSEVFDVHTRAALAEATRTDDHVADRRARSTDEHRELLRLLTAGDGIGAAEHWRRHIAALDVGEIGRRRVMVLHPVDPRLLG